MSATIYILKGLVPYSRQNLLLTHKPKRFFAELARTSGYSEPTLRAAYFRAHKSQLITNENAPRLTLRGRQKIQPFVAQKLTRGGKLMVIFDIPVSMDARRRHFRTILQELEFQQVQQSVWMCRDDHRAIIRETVEDMGLQDCVQMYEAARIAL